MRFTLLYDRLCDLIVRVRVVPRRTVVGDFSKGNLTRLLVSAVTQCDLVHEVCIIEQY